MSDAPRSTPPTTVSSEPVSGDLHLLAQVADLVPDALFLIDADGRFVAVNEMTVRQLGYSREELCRMRVSDIDPEYPPEAWPEVWKRIRGRGHLVIESVHRAKDGREFPVEIIARHLKTPDGEYSCAFAHDITVRKQTEEAVRARAHEFQALFETLPFVVWQAAPDGRCRYVNRAWETFTGTSRDQALQEGWLRLVHEDDVERAREEFRHAAQEIRPYATSFRLRDGDGGFRWVAARGVPQRGDDGHLLGYVGWLIDVTEQRRHEELLVRIARGLDETAAPDFFEALVEHAAEILGADCVAVCERRPADGQTVRSLALWRDGAMRSPIEYSLEGTPCRLICDGQAWTYPREVCARFPDDEELQVLQAQAYAGVPLMSRDGTCLGLIWAVYREPLVSIETTESLLRILASRAAGELDRLRAAETLRASEARFRAIFEQASIGVAHVQTDSGRVLAANRRYCEILGRPAEQVIGHCFREWTHPDDQSRNAELMERLAAGDMSEFSLEKRYLRPDGQVVWVSLSVSPMGTEGQVARTHITVVVDITDRKRAEQQKNELEAQLRQSQKMEAIGRLAGGVAHDFNNLLSVIIGNAALVLQEETGDEILREAVEEIRAAGQRGAELTRQLLAFGRKQVGRRELLEPEQIVLGTQKLLGRLLGEDVDLSLELEPDLPLVRADRSQIEQVLVNLAVNARDAMPDGGRLVIRVRRQHLVESAARTLDVEPGEYVTLQITDTGTGMDEATCGRALEPFFTTKERGKGTGLGLSTAYATVRNHSGALEIESEPGRGTTVLVHLPASDTAADRTPSEPPARELAPGQGTVLLVEDEDAVRRLAERVLRSHGYRVLSTGDPYQALHWSEQDTETIDLLLTDLVMPGMNGAALARRITELRPKLPLLFISGYTADAIDERGITDLGACFLQKPFDPKDLARAVQTALASGASSRLDG